MRLSVEEELAADGAGQRWYCLCGKRYQPKFGMLVEVTPRTGKGNVAYYVRAECQPEEVKELWLMAGQGDRSGMMVKAGPQLPDGLLLAEDQLTNHSRLYLYGHGG